jgi:hypothetical protein
MNLGQGLVALFRVPGQPGLESYHLGDTVGQYKLVDVNSDGSTLEWNGQKFFAGVSAAPVASDAGGSDAGRTAGPAAPAPPPPPALKGPGEDSGRGYRNCTMTDGQPEGSVVDGFRKVVYSTPFGQACRYEPVR